MTAIVNALIQRIAKSSTQLTLKLKQAEISDTPEEFIKKSLVLALYMSIGIVVFLWLLLSRLGPVTLILLMLFPVLFVVFLFYFLRVPDVKVLKKQRDINKEIIFAGRFLIIELESGVPLYDAFKNVTKNYEVIGKYFAEIVNKVDLGTAIEDAMNETIEFTPSANFRKILWQIVNSQQTGADVSSSLKSVVEQITKEQIIEIKEYGRKLNPLAMFYMIIAVILPSIGITMFIVLSTFLNLTLKLPILLSISVGLAIVQCMFLAMIKQSRPSVEL